MSMAEGHRQRLRQKFNEHPASLSKAELLELLLGYAIPRRDVAPLARELIDQFGSLEAVLNAPVAELSMVGGLGEYALTLFKLFNTLISEKPSEPVDMTPIRTIPPPNQLNLFGTEVVNLLTGQMPGRKKSQMRVFANDEIANTLELLPKAAEFETLDSFKQHLNEKLPYNAAETRQRRANYIIERYFPEGTLEVPLTLYLARRTTLADLKPVIFYHLLTAEPIAAKVAEELIWPALPIGRVEREQMREFVLRYLPETKIASQAKILQALFHTYDLLGIGSVNDTTLRFQLRSGTLESFLYILTCEFPEPGMYSFEALYNSPIHRWLLWDREWIRRQLYNLQDFGVLTKVSEIDTVRQFSLSLDQRAALHMYFEHPERQQMAIRDQTERQNADQEG